MNRLMVTAVLLLTALPLAGSAVETLHRPAGANGPLPRLVLWAWERTEDLSYIDPRTTAVAFHAVHLRVEGATLRVKRRRHPLRVPAGTPLIAVAHFSVARPDSALIPQICETVIGLTRQPGVVGLQLDFEAVPSQRDFYRRLARELRAETAPGFFFSATALASWCFADGWMDPSPFDEVVPMFFDMGKGAREIADAFAGGADFGPSWCRTSVGIKAGTPIPARFGGRRLYVFNPHRWTANAYRRVTAEVL